MQDRDLKRVYLGLPEHLASCVKWVSSEFRTNPLSQIPGGSDVVVEYHDGSVFGYDRIKFPSNYIPKIFENIDKELSIPNKELSIPNTGSSMEKIAKILARKYKNEDEFWTVPFEEAWNSKMPTTTSSLRQALARFDQQRYSA